MFRAPFQGTIIRNEPAYRARPVTVPGYHKFSNGEYDAFVQLSTLEVIADKARQAAPNEMIGYLVGRPFCDAKGPYAVVTDAIFAQSARCGPMTVETTLDDERGLLTTLLVDHPLAERLGWFHSHPFFMPTYSPTDLENQRFWSEPYQLGLLACLDPAGSVSIFAFRGPEAEAIHPPYTTSGGDSNRVPTFRPMRAMQNRKATPKPALPTKQKRQRRYSLTVLTLAVGVVWPIVYLIGVGMLVQAIQEGRNTAARTTTVARNGTASAGALNNRDPVEVASPEASNDATPPKSVQRPTQKSQQLEIDDR
jgi:proteasome lid subunit RPN8/RPN11